MRRRSLLAVIVALVPALGLAAPLTPSSGEQSAINALAQRLPTARLLWVNNDKIWHSELGDWDPQSVTGSGLSERSPRWSPDGGRIAFVREPDAVWVMNADFSGAQQLIPFADTPTWTRDGRYITAISVLDRHQVIQYDTQDGSQSVIYDSNDGDYAGGYGAGDPLVQAAELRVGGRFLLTFTDDRAPGGSHHTYIVDLQQHGYLYNDEMDRGDCSPAWAPDGSYAINTARTSNRPVVKASFNAGGPSVSPSTVLIGLDPAVCGGCTTFYIHGQRIANGGEWLTFGGLPRSGDFSGNREIYVWKMGEAEDSAVRVSFETNEDSSPDLYIFPGGPQDAGVRPDSSSPDSSRPDTAAGADTARPDVGSSADTAIGVDRAQADAASSVDDAATMNDAAAGDAASIVDDAAQEDAWLDQAPTGSWQVGDGCACGQAAGARGVWGLLALALLIVARRRGGGRDAI